MSCYRTLTTATGTALYTSVLRWIRRQRWLILVTLGAAAVTLGYVGFSRSLAAAGEARSPTDIAYITLQLFTIESGAVAGPVSWQLDVARFLAPLVAAFAIVEAWLALFREQFKRWRVRRWTGHAVIYGDGDAAVSLAAEFSARGSRVILAAEQPPAEIVEAARADGRLVLLPVRADASQTAVAKASCVVAVTTSDSMNADLVVAAVKAGSLAKRSSPLVARALVADKRVVALLHAADLSSATVTNAWIGFFSFNELIARQVLGQHPLDREPVEGSVVVQLVFVGFDTASSAILLQALRIGHYANLQPLRITIIDAEAPRHRARLLARYPQLEQACTLTVVAAEPEGMEAREHLHQIAMDPTSLSTLVVTAPAAGEVDSGDDTALVRAIDLPSAIREQSLPVLVRFTRSSSTAHLLGERLKSEVYPNLTFFGDIKRNSCIEIVVQEALDEQARAIHEDYVRRRMSAGESEATNPSLRAWERLDTTLQDSCRQQADHIAVKLRAVGCACAPVHIAPPGSHRVDQFEPEEVELLAKMEHQRWNADRWLAGWRSGPMNKPQRVTPYLVPWEQLSEQIREYDREAVRNIPSWLQLRQLAVFREEPSRKPRAGV